VRVGRGVAVGTGVRLGGVAVGTVGDGVQVDGAVAHTEVGEGPSVRVGSGVQVGVGDGPQVGVKLGGGGVAVGALPGDPHAASARISASPVGNALRRTATRFSSPPA